MPVTMTNREVQNSSRALVEICQEKLKPAKAFPLHLTLQELSKVEDAIADTQEGIREDYFDLDEHGAIQWEEDEEGNRTDRPIMQDGYTTEAFQRAIEEMLDLEVEVPVRRIRAKWFVKNKVDVKPINLFRLGPLFKMDVDVDWSGFESAKGEEDED